MPDLLIMRPIAYRRYLLTLLVVLLAFNFMDRIALGLVRPSIKSDLKLSDTQLGVLTGIAFAVFYALMGIPIARWADRGNRVRIIAITAALWSVAVALCGVAGSFAELLVIRSAVAVGEAGGYVPGFSLIADYFTRSERPRAIAIYILGGPLSIISGYLLAGWLSELYGWRVMFALLGLPGLLLALIAHLTLRDPRQAAEKTAGSGDAATLPGAQATLNQESLMRVCKTIFAIRTFRQLLYCLSVMFFFVYGFLQWQPSFFMRSFGLSSREVGNWFAATYGIGGLLGTYLGGAWASKYAAHNERLQLQVVAAGMAIAAILSCAIYLSANPRVAIVLSGVVMFSLTACNGPVYAAIQSLVPERMRAMSAAVVLLFANLIGMGLGPLATGAISDELRPLVGEDSLRYALMALSPGYLLVGFFALRGSRTVMSDLDVTEIEIRDCTSGLRPPLPEWRPH
jgi:MFS family permease